MTTIAEQFLIDRDKAIADRREVKIPSPYKHFDSSAIIQFDDGSVAFVDPTDRSFPGKMQWAISVTEAFHARFAMMQAASAPTREQLAEMVNSAHGVLSAAQTAESYAASALARAKEATTAAQRAHDMLVDAVKRMTNTRCNCGWIELPQAERAMSLHATNCRARRAG